MKLFKLLFFGVMMVQLFGCASFDEEGKVSTLLKVRQFNDVADRYDERVTVVTFSSQSSPNSALFVKVDVHSKTGPKPMSWIRFSEDNVENYIELIDKYLKWEKIAVGRGDKLEKVIGEAPDGNILDLTFKFKSLDSKEHYLVVSNCNYLCLENSSHHYYDRDNAIVLKDLLIGLKEHQFLTTKNKEDETDLDEIYN